MPSPANRPWLGVLTALAVAAAVVVAVRVMRSPPENDPYRDVPHTSIRSHQVEVARSHATLSWAPVDPEAMVQLRVFDAALNPLYQASGKGLTEAAIPVEALSTIPTGGEVLWHVEITAPQTAPTRSPTFRTPLRD